MLTDGCRSRHHDRNVLCPFHGRQAVAAIILSIFLMPAGQSLAANTPASGNGTPRASASVQNETPEHKVYFDLPEILANLNDKSQRKPIIKLDVTLELAQDSDVDRAQNVLPRIIDDFQSYIRECRSSELAGSAGMSRLREALLARANVEMQPFRVSDLLFKEIIID